jgi:hypothetical protein
MIILHIGSVCFGLFLGYVTYRTLARTTDKTSINDLTAVVAAVGGGAVTALFEPQTEDFGYYAIGLLAGFIAYGALFRKVNGKAEFAKVMGLPGRPVGTPGAQGVQRGPSAPLPPGA